MNKMQKGFLKQSEQEVKKQLKASCKEKQYKIVSNSLYKREQDFFIHTVFFVRQVDINACIIIWNDIKPYDYDDLFWDILHMDANKKTCDSFRANGAFVAPSYRISERQFLFSAFEEIPSLCKSIYDDTNEAYSCYLRKIDGDVREFNKQMLSKSGFLNQVLIQILANLQLRRYEEALVMASEEVSNNKRGGFSNEGKDIYQHVIDYCRLKTRQ